MTTIVTRAGKGSALTHAEGDANFTNLNTDKIESDDVRTLSNKSISLTDNTVTGTTIEFNAALSDNDFATQAGIETLTNKTLTNPDINGGTADSLTSLSVAAGSYGNVSRWIMTTANGGTGVEDGANTWAKMATFTPTADNFSYIGKHFLIQDGFQGQTNSSAIVSVFLTQNTAGLDTSDTDLKVISIDGGTRLSSDSFKLVSAAATNGTAVDLYINKKTIYGRFSLYELSSNEYPAARWTVTENNNAAWQSATPSGAVNITSDWAGNGPLTSTSLSNSTGTVYYEKSSDGFVTVDFDLATLTTTTDATTYFTMPAGFRHGITGMTIDSILSGVITGGAAGALRMTDAGVVAIYNYAASTGNWRASFRYRARS